MGMFLRRGKPSLAWQVIISGILTSNYSYVTIDGVKYSEKAELLVNSGTIVEIYVSAVGSSDQRFCHVNLNGKTVLRGSGTYDYTVESNTTINFVQGPPISRYYACNITTT